MQKSFSAIYEQGMLRPDSPLTDLVDGQRVWVLLRDVTDDREEFKRREARLIREMIDDGRIAQPIPYTGPVPQDFEPLVIEGEPLSEQIIRERR